MCWQCQNPGATREDYLAMLDEKRRRHGWAVQFVERNGPRAALAYTVGLTSFELPELVVTGLTMVRAGRLLNNVASHVLHADAPEPGERIPMPGWSLEVVELDQPTAHLFVVADFYGADFSALQLVWADDRGRWPWEQSFRSSRGGQPVLGPRSTS